MWKNPNITQFVKIINDSQTLKDYFNNNYLVVFVPSNDAMSSANLAGLDMEKVVKSHMYTSVTSQNADSVIGTTANWPNYLRIVSKNTTYYRTVSLDNLNVFFMYIAEGQQFRVNDANLISRNNTNANQTYHIVDKVFVNYQDIKFIDYLKSNTALSKSWKLWKALTDAADTGGLQNISPFKSAFITLTSSLFATILVPTDAAWAVFDVDGLIRSKNYSLLNTIMVKYYIPMNLVFLTGDNVNFMAGFSDLQTQSNAGLLPGLITKDLQVKVNTSSGRVLQANIPLDFGVVHIIDNSLHIPVTLNAYFEQTSKIYLDYLNKFPNVKVLLNESNTFLPIEDIAMAKIVNNPNIEQILLNSIIPGKILFNETNPPINTMGGLSIKLISVNSKYYLAAYQSQEDNTWVSIVPVLALNQIVGSTFVTKLDGSLSNTPDTCDSTLNKINSSLYQELISSNNNNVTLNIGSPYTMFVPNNAFLYPFVANFASMKHHIIKYTIQRMIIANRMILQKQPAGFFYAATMNYAAMAENINMTIVGSNLTIQFNEFNRPYNFSGGGIYCYSNSMNDSTRYNLIYPVPFVVSSISDNSSKICVTAPCIACHTTYNYLLLIAVILLMIRHIPTANI